MLIGCYAVSFVKMWPTLQISANVLADTKTIFGGCSAGFWGGKLGCLHISSQNVRNCLRYIPVFLFARCALQHNIKLGQPSTCTTKKCCSLFVFNYRDLLVWIVNIFAAFSEF